jgi:hypothetical protein
MRGVADGRVWTHRGDATLARFHHECAALHPVTDSNALLQ